MKHKFFITHAVLCLLFTVTDISAQTRDYSNTIRVIPGDSEETIISKAVHVVPDGRQLSSMKREFIAFVHFGPNTFTGKEWGTGMEDPSVFALRNLDTDQWCRAIKAAGMKMVILTVKHHDGFVLWQSRYTDHGIMSSGFKDGKGDVLRELSRSCRKYGLNLGVYLSPADLYQIESPDGLYGNLSKKTERIIPRPVEGRPFRNKTTFRFAVDDYNEYFLNQLFELLTEYGPIHEVWFDGAHPKRKGGQQYDYAAWKELIRTLAPEASVFGREDIRWCGNEAGDTRDTEWNVIAYDFDPDTSSVFPDMTDYDLGSRKALCNAKYLHYQPAETNTSIREGWFYRDEEQKVRSADDVFDIYERSVGGNSIFLLNMPPDRNGRLPDKDVSVLEEVGEMIRRTYGRDLLVKSDAPRAVLDDDPDTYVELTPDSNVIEIVLPQPSTINRLVLQEAVAARGERVEEHFVEVLSDGQWKKIAGGTNIGYKRILRFPEVTTDRIRITVSSMRADASISKVSAHHYASRPPRLSMKRSVEGMVTIEPVIPAFNWKPHGENTISNLYPDLRIYYTTDGTAPSEASLPYEGPFHAEKADISAVAVSNSVYGPAETCSFGLVKKGWSVSYDGTSVPEHWTDFAIDDSPDTWWAGSADGNRTLILDLGEEAEISGFSYTPPSNSPEGLVSKGTVSVSQDGTVWTGQEEFEFGNILNNPVTRVHRLNSPAKARFVRIEITGVAGDRDSVAVAEFGLF